MTKTIKRQRFTKQQRKAKILAKKAAKDAAPIRAEVVRADDGTVQKVEYRGFSFRNIQHQLVVASSHFTKDYSLAFPLRCVGFELGVDGGRAHSGYIASVSAQERLRDLRKSIGERDYAILTAVVIIGVGPTELEKTGGPRATETGYEIRRILRDVSTYYSGRSLKPDKLLSAAHRVLEAVSFDRKPEKFDLEEIERARDEKLNRSRGSDR